MILLISDSSVAWIVGMSHLHQATWSFVCGEVFLVSFSYFMMTQVTLDEELILMALFKFNSTIKDTNHQTVTLKIKIKPRNLGEHNKILNMGIQQQYRSQRNREWQMSKVVKLLCRLIEKSVEPTED
jgi:hypothetical protein